MISSFELSLFLKEGTETAVLIHLPNKMPLSICIKYLGEKRKMKEHNYSKIITS